MEKRAIIFDMDGTLLDSERLSQRAWDEAAREHNLRVDWPLFLKMVGHRTPDCLQIMRDFYGENRVPDAIGVRAPERYLQLVAQGVPAMLGAREILEFCRSRGLKIGIATSTRRAYAQAKLEHADFWQFVDAMTCGNEVSVGKPAPEIYQKTAEKLGCVPAECFAVEDSPTGFRSAFDAGCTTFLVPDLVPPTPDALRDAAKVFKNLLELRDFLAGTLFRNTDFTD